MTIHAERLRGAGLPELTPVLARQGPPLLFATVSGAHLYGFPSRDSDVDLRGVHLLPLADLIGLREGEETQTRMWEQEGLELDLVTHDLLKFARLMLRRNGYVLEQLLSPLVVHTSAVHAQLADLAPGVITGHHAHHYRGFARTQWELYEKTGELKPLLYTFRVLLTGIHLMRTGTVEAHLPTLLDHVTAPGYVSELIQEKAAAEHGLAMDLDPRRVSADVGALHAALDDAQRDTRLPDEPTAHEALHDLVVRTRVAV
ncbi:nucleotidyltransferase domain-containing protein [Streptomyces sp. ME01-24h]|nr:nucleotidyltransferase domain-containing protein [Streptomyces sp. ME19-03-3]MDX3353019.1 nucleotidyltransferase domain-containing protein [Streptomyces sp. ME01-24h]